MSDVIKIVVLQRGWVVVGKFSQVDQTCYIDNGFVIRRWGTSKGLGEIAKLGPLDKTVLDSSPRIEFNIYTVVMSIICENEKWNAICK